MSNTLPVTTFDSHSFNFRQQHSNTATVKYATTALALAMILGGVALAITASSKLGGFEKIFEGTHKLVTICAVSATAVMIFGAGLTTYLSHKENTAYAIWLKAQEEKTLNKFRLIPGSFPSDIKTDEDDLKELLKMHFDNYILEHGLNSVKDWKQRIVREDKARFLKTMEADLKTEPNQQAAEVALGKIKRIMQNRNELVWYRG